MPRVMESPASHNDARRGRGGTQRVSAETAIGGPPSHPLLERKGRASVRTAAVEARSIRLENPAGRPLAGVGPRAVDTRPGR